MTSYARPVTSINSDITLVGGPHAAVGEVRTENDGKRYVLALAGAEITAKWIVKNTAVAGSVIKVTDGATCTGVNHNTSAVPSGSYFWMQTYGLCDDVVCAPTAKGDWIKGSTALGGITAIADDAVIGYAFANTGAANDLFIDPRGV